MAHITVIPDRPLQVGLVDKGQHTLAAIRIADGSNIVDVFLSRDNLESLIAALDAIAIDPDWINRQPT